MTGMTPEELQSELYSKIRDEFLYYFGDVGEAWISYAADYFWDESCQDFRLADLKMHGITPHRQAKVLDLAAGCGQFLFKALDAGYDCYGIEPEKWKLDHIRKKINVYGRPMDWAERITAGIGENLPYQDNSFDGVTTYQTLEHVQDPFKVLSEMVRITRPGGIILIRCPDYTSTFEAHYRLAWMPLMPRFIAKAYLRLRGRPTRGLDAIHYVTKSKIIRWSTKIERESGCRLHLVDSDFIAFSNGLRRRGLFAPLLGYPAYRAAKYLLNVFRREMDVNIAIRVVTKAA